MKQTMATAQKSSVQARKQRAARHNAKLHTLQKFMRSALSAELRKSHKRRSVQVRKGDTVKVMRGQFKGTLGKVELVNLKGGFLHVAGCERLKRDGSKSALPINPSNVQIHTLDLADSKRKATIARVAN